MKIRYYILLFILFVSSNVFALDFCSYTDEYIEYMNMSPEEKKNIVAPIMCKEFEEETNRQNNIDNVRSILKGKTTDSKYSSVDLGYVTTPKNQYYDGLCWDFSATGNVESLALKNNIGRYDLSEAHMAYSLISQMYNDEAGKMGKYDSDGLGGQLYYSSSYYFGNYGVLSEEEQPYTYPNLNKIYSSNYKKGKNLFSIDKFSIINISTPSSCSNSQISNIKEAVLNTGSVQATVFMDEKLLANNYYYLSRTTNSKYANHAVLIVGWDDTISKNLFNGATKDGAWIVKNSWGDSWGDNGYYYISYEDNFVCVNSSYYDNISTETYDNNYETSSLVGSNNPFDSHIYIASKFTNKTNNKEQIKKISFATPYMGSYKIYITTNIDYQNTSYWELVGEGSNKDSYGLDSITLNKVVDDDFYVIIEYKSTVMSSIYMLSACDNDPDIAKYTKFEQGKNYISSNQVDWNDMATTSVKCKPNIYVYTDEYTDELLDVVFTGTETTNDLITINYRKQNNTNYSYKVMKGDEDVTSHFEIIDTGSSFKLTPDNLICGTFRFILTIGNDSTYINFKLDSEVIPMSNDIVVEDDYIYVSVPVNSSITASELTNKLDVNNTSLKIVNEGNIDVNKLYTGARFVTDDKEYRIIIKGDTNSDGSVNSADLMKVVKYLKGIDLNPYQFKAGELTKDGTINSADLMRIVKYLKGTISL